MFWSLTEKRTRRLVQSVCWDKDSEEKEQRIITESPIKNLWSNFIMEKNGKKFGLLKFPNIITEQWGYYGMKTEIIQKTKVGAHININT